MADTTFPGMVRSGTAASRPAASAVAKGTVYFATDTGVVSQSDTSTWTTLGTTSGSTAAPQFATIELGHASDTTLARVSAGVVSIEGTNIVKAGAATGSGLTMATARILGRTTASSGAIEEITVGSGLSLSAGSLTATGAAGSITYASGVCSADVTLTANTMADATGASVSLAAGTWLVYGTMTFNSNASAGYCLVYLRDGSNADYSSGRGYMTAAKYLTIPIPPTIVTPGSTTTFKLSGQAENTNDAIKRYANGTVPATMIAAIKVA